MRTVNFRDQVVYALAYKMGLDPINDLILDQAAAYVSFINSWVRKLYPAFDWPEWTLIEQRTPTGRYVDFAQAGQNAIGRVLKVYLADPSANPGILDTSFKLNASGIFVGFEAGTSVWIKYIKPAPQYTSEVWSSSSTYAKDKLIYETTGGNVYISLQNGNTNHAPASNPTWWTLVPFPEELMELVVRGAYSDALREDGQTDKGAAEEQATIQQALIQTGLYIHPGYDPISDQSRPAPRYRLPGLEGATVGT